MIVLDTHIFVWWNQQDPKLTNYHREVISRERTNGLGICTLSKKCRVGKSPPFF
jgi:PIN domain nuclease of toxin-antitoxin system